MLAFALQAAMAFQGDPSAKLLNLLHAYYDGVFQDLELTKGKWVEEEVNGKTVRVWRPATFGVSRARAIPIVGQHYLDWTNLSREASALAKREGLRYFAAVYGAGGVALSSRNLALRFGPEAVNADALGFGDFESSKILDFAKGSLEPILAGKTATGGATPWGLQARGVFLKKPECLKCHAGMKLNQPVAIMVYGTRR